MPKRTIMESSPLRGEFYLYHWPYDANAVLKKEGWRWSAERKCWWTDRQDLALGYVRFADEDTRSRLLAKPLQR